MKTVSPETRIIGVEPLGAASMSEAMFRKQVVTLDDIDKFVDGAAVKRVGDLTYDICSSILDDIVKVPEGKACTTILELYNENAIVVEPAVPWQLRRWSSIVSKLWARRWSVSLVAGTTILTGCRRSKNVLSSTKV